MRDMAQKVAFRWLVSTQEPIPFGDMVVFPGSPYRKDFWRGSEDPVLRPGEYFAEDPQVALWYARNFARSGYVTGYDIQGRVLDATKDPVGVLKKVVGGFTNTESYDRAWEIMEEIPGVVEALQDQGYEMVKFYDVAPSHIIAYKYIGSRTLKGRPVLKVVEDSDIRKYLPPLCQKLWGDRASLPISSHGWRALGDAVEDLREGFELGPPEEYLESVPEKLYGGRMPQWDDVFDVI